VHAKSKKNDEIDMNRISTLLLILCGKDNNKKGLPENQATLSV
jgi:hypothetical protein